MDKNQPIALIDYDFDNNKIVIEYNGNCIRVAGIDGKFPEWRRIIPDSVSGEAGQYNSDYIADFKKMANFINGTKNADCFIKQNGEQVAIVDICANKPDYDIHGMGLLMPLRKTDSDFANYSRPKWLEPAKPDLKAVA